MRRQRNPLAPRLRHVTSLYDDHVAMAAFGAWATAMDARVLRERMAFRFYRQGENAARTFLKLEEALACEGVAANTRYDRHLPWIARELRRVYRPYERLAKRRPKLRKYPYDHVRSQPFYIPAEQKLVDAIAVATRKMQRSFRNIVEWAEANEIDLFGYTFAEALAETEKWQHEQQREAQARADVAAEIAKIRQQLASVLPGLPPVQGTVVFEFPDGWTVQVLRTLDQLMGEGHALNHCLGSQDLEQVRSGALEFFSIRDQWGASKATLEWMTGLRFVRQLRGYKNALPDPGVFFRAVTFREQRLRSSVVRRAGLPAELEWISAIPDSLCGVYQAPDGTRFVVFIAASGNWSAFEAKALQEGYRETIKNLLSAGWPPADFDFFLQEAPAVSFAQPVKPPPDLAWAVWQDCNGALPAARASDDMIRWLQTNRVC